MNQCIAFGPQFVHKIAQCSASRGYYRLLTCISFGENSGFGDENR